MRLALCLLLLALAPLPSLAADYQWSATVDEIVSTETGGHPRAFLWIPPDCRKVRALLIGQHNMQEEPILEHPAMRQTLAGLCFGALWVTPAMGSNHFRFDLGAGAMLERLMQTLAARSGYGELATAPLVPIGHSAMASFGWDMAAWNPQRVLAVISTSGIWPYFKDPGTGNAAGPEWGERSVDGVPGLVIKGEYEVQGNMRDGWYAGAKGDSLTRHPRTVLTHVIEPGGGHFEVSDQRVELMALFLRKAAQYRLARNGSLTPIDPRRGGWLFDGWQRDTVPAAPAAPVASYRGPRDRAYWAFDAEMAKAVASFQGRFRQQDTLLIGYRQQNGLTRPRPDHAMVHLKFEPLEDGISFRLRGGFWDQVPGDARPDPATGVEGSGGWGKFFVPPRQAGQALAHPDTAEEARMRISRICGPVIQTAPDTFSIRFYRMGMNNIKRSNDMWFALSWPGDGRFKPMVQQAQLQIPLTNKEGQAQTLSFPAIADQPARRAMAPVQLAATSSAGVPVYYYVREGPAEVDDSGLLRFTPIPARASLPIEVTVVAWQWGRSIEPKLQSAAPLEQRFLITSPPSP